MPTFERTEFDFGFVDAAGSPIPEPEKLEPLEKSDARFAAVIENPLGRAKPSLSPVNGPNRTSAEFNVFNLGNGRAPGTKVTMVEAAGRVGGKPVFRKAMAFIVRSGR